LKNVLVAAVVAAVVAAASGSAATMIITSKNIKNGTIQTVDISAAAKRALKGNRGPQGAQGPPGLQGSAGPVGPQGPPGIQSLTAVESNTVSVPPGSYGEVTANCPSGQRPVSGGFVFGGITIGSFRVGPGWYVAGFNDLGGAHRPQSHRLLLAEHHNGWRGHDVGEP
jgi:hypothetical protein